MVGLDNILVFTTDINDSTNYTPAVFYSGRTHLFLVNTGGTEDEVFALTDDDLPLNAKTTVKLQIKGTSLKVFFNNEMLIEETVGAARPQLALVDVYLGGTLGTDNINAIISDVSFCESYE